MINYLSLEFYDFWTNESSVMLSLSTSISTWDVSYLICERVVIFISSELEKGQCFHFKQEVLTFFQAISHFYESFTWLDAYLLPIKFFIWRVTCIVSVHLFDFVLLSSVTRVNYSSIKSILIIVLLFKLFFCLGLFLIFFLDYFHYELIFDMLEK